jgi:hypothetical protein
MATTTRKLRLVNSESDASTSAPAVRTITKWSFELLRAAEHQADMGNMRLAAQACEWLLTDDAIAGALSARVDALLGLVPTFEASGDKRRSNRAVKALEAGEDWWESYPESELDQIHTWGILLGVAPARQNWRANEDHGGRVLAYPEFWHPETLQFSYQTREWSVQNALGQRITITPGGPEWILHTPYGKSRPWARGLWRSLKNWALLQQLAQQDFSRAGEKSRQLVGTSPEESTRKQREELANDLMNSGEDAAIILAAGFDLKALQMPAVLPELYSRQIQLAKTAIATRIRGGNLSTEVRGDGGTQAAAKVQRATGDQPKLRWDAQALATTTHDQSLVWWAEFNYGDRRLAPWPVWPVEPEEDKRLSAETEEKALANLEKAEQLGLEVDRKAFLDAYGIEWAKPGAKPEPPKPPEGQQPPAPGEPGQNAPAPPTGSEPPRDRIEARAEVPRLASGFLAAKASGFLNGQLYADAVVEHATAQAEKLLQPTVDAVLEELDAATDYDDLRERLRARYEQLDPEQLNELVARAMWLGEMAGRAAVNEDA